MSFSFTERARLAALAILAVTFAAGMLAGAAYSRVLGADEPERPAERRQQPRWRGERGILDSLDLTSEQRARIDSIAAAGRRRTDSLWQVDGARIRTAVDSTRAAIRTVMTAEQRTEYERIRDRFDAERRREKERNGHGSTAVSAEPPSR